MRGPHTWADGHGPAGRGGPGGGGRACLSPGKVVGPAAGVGVGKPRIAATAAGGIGSLGVVVERVLGEAPVCGTQ